MNIYRAFCPSLYRQTERGNVLFMILIAIILFGALSFTVAQIMRSGNPNMITDQKAYIAATEILDYAQAVKNTVHDLRINGCSDTEISFENNIVSGYTNGSNTACQIFHEDGGGMTWMAPSLEMNDGSDWFFGVNRVGAQDGSAQFGTSANDLVVLLPNVLNKVCEKLDDMLNNYNVWESGSNHNYTTKFQGSYTLASLSINAGTLGASINPPTAGCFCDIGGTCEDNPDAPRYFYQVLIVR